MPISSRIFSPFIYNPAIAGSKEFSSIDFIAILQGTSKSQIINGSTRLLKTVPGYFPSHDYKDFSNIGIGGSIFNDINGTYHNAGISGTLSYHIALSNKNLSFISLGASIKGMYNFNQHSFHPNTDLGIYYYGISLFAGFSVNNLLGNQGYPDSIGMFDSPMMRQYIVTSGYKIIISQPLKIVLEPSFIMNVNDSTLSKLVNNIHPLLKLYVENLCIGTFFNDYSKISFFLQYKFPRLYLGAFVEVPKKAPYYLYKTEPLIEFSMGINISRNRSRFPMLGHW